MNCPKCGTMLPDESRFCAECGANIAETEAVVTAIPEEEATAQETVSETRRCIVCGEELPGDSMFCLVCGTKQPEAFSKKTQESANEQINTPEPPITIGDEQLKESADEHPDYDQPLAASSEVDPLQEQTIQNQIHPVSQTAPAMVMYCVNCGKKLEAGSRFCDVCGTKQPPVNQPAPSGHYRRPAAPMEPPRQLTPEEEAKAARNRKIVLFSVLGVILLGIIIILCVELIKPTVKLDKYVEITSGGYNNYGYPVVTFDLDKMASKYGKRLDKAIGHSSKKNKKTASKDKYDLYYDDNDQAETYDTTSVRRFLEDCVTYEFSASEGLSTGQTITLYWDIDKEKALEKYNIKVKGKEIEYTVEELDTANLVNPFESDPTFGGMGPNGYLYWYPQLAYPFNYYFNIEVDRPSELSNGDEVKFTLVPNGYYGDIKATEKELATNYDGILPSYYSKTYTVTGLEYYYDNQSQIPAESFGELKDNAISSIYINGDSSQSVKGIEYVGSYFMYSPDAGYKNYLTLVYRVVVKNDHALNMESAYHALNEFYWCYTYRNVYGTDSQVSGYDTQKVYDTVIFDSGIRSSRYSYYNKSWSYNGYYSIDDLYNAVVAPLEYSGDYSYAVEKNINTDNVTPLFEMWNEGMEIPEDTAKEYEITRVIGMLFPESDRIKLTREKLEELEYEQLDYAIYEIYARHGMRFETEPFASYYRALDWYTPTYSPDAFSESMLNAIEIYNINIIRSEKSKY